MSKRRIRHQGKVIGEYLEKDDKVVFRKYVEPKKHRLRIFDAYGIQRSAFDKHLAGKDGVIEIKEKGGRTLTSSIGDWENMGITKDLGDGPQIFLSLSYMASNNERQKKLL